MNGGDEPTLRVAADAVPIAVLAVDRHGLIRSANASAAAMFGYPLRELVGGTVHPLVPGGRDEARRLLQDALRRDRGGPGSSPFEARELIAVRKDGSPFPVEASVTFEGRGDALLVHLVLVDLTDRRRHEEQVRHQGLHDPLTGLANRVLLNERVAHALETSRGRGSGRTVAALFCGLDQFKLVNDSLGHQVGDQLLRAVADRLASILRPGDTVARFGGDEFVVLCEDVEQDRDALGLVARVQAALGEPIVLAGVSHHVTTSIGMATAGAAVRDADTLLRNADVAMERAKARGRGRFEIFDERLQAECERAYRLTTALAGAVDRDELRLVFQPVHHLEAGRVVAFEALVRWRHDGEEIPPGEFIPLAERTGSIGPIGSWVLREAIAQLARWAAEGHRARVSVNLSARQLTGAALVDEIAAEVARAGVDPAHLAFEVTETALLDREEHALEALTGLRQLGSRLLLDDFGTGYSSLSHVARFPVDGIKVDRSFVARCPGDAGAVAVVDAIVGLASGLDCVVVAEGVETEEQAEHVRAAGCAYAQGYLLGRPLELEAADALLADTLTMSSAPRERG